jgi:DNA-binding transcriptional LysR family regulator
MNWQAISFDWNQARALLATAEEGSYSGAARALKSTQPTVGRQISSLEDALGVTLVERSVKGQKLTQVGIELVNHIRAMGEAATLVTMTADRQSQAVTGEVVITATDLLSALIIPAALSPLRDMAPGITIRINSSNDIENLTQRDADIAIRHAQPTAPDLIAQNVGDFGANLYASNAYLERAGRPRTMQDLAGHAFVGNPDLHRLILPLQNLGIPIRPENFAMLSENGVTTWEMVKAGYGMSMQPEILGDAEPSVEKVISEFPSWNFPIWIVTHREIQTSPRIRIVFDLLASELANLSRSER